MKLLPFFLSLIFVVAVQAKPNIVYILADDLGYGDVGVFNPRSKIPTPNLDRLAGQGVRFTDAHAPSSVCTPTRYALLTGRLAWRSPLKGGVLGPWDAPLIEKTRLTLPAFLKQNGYHTSAIGKWHLGWTWPTRDGKPPASGDDRLSNVDFSQPIADGPTTRGFDDYFGVDVPNYPPYVFIENDRSVGIPSQASGPQFNRPGPVLPGWDWVQVLPDLTRRTVAYIEKTGAGSKPYFLYVALTSPHYPIVPAPGFRGKSGAGDYGDFVVQTDWTVGQILDAIDRSGQAANTLVIFTSDNGPERTGEVNPGAYERIQQHAHSSAGDFRGVKRDLWEGGHRVPFIARWPDKIPPGTVSAETISHVDLFATAAAILGADIPESAAPDSFNILPALLGETYAAPLRPATIHHGGNGSLAIRQGDWVLIDAPSGDNNREPDWRKQEWQLLPHHEPAELYNLRQDPSQRSNQWAAEPEKARELKALLEQIKADGRSTAGPKLANDPAMLKKQTPPGSRPPREGPWKAGDLLSSEEAPAIAGRAITVTATITPGEGVILAQGGARHGYALYAKNHRLIFAVRIDGTLASVEAALPDRGSTVSARLEDNGSLVLTTGGSEVARAKAPGTIASQPGDPLSVGHDAASPVAAYSSPHPYSGSVTGARVAVGQP